MGWDAVYQLVKKIPRGCVVTYGQIARALRLRGGARAVGYAMAACPSGRGIPWHRVIGVGGRLRVPEPYISLQIQLLESEGIKVVHGRVDLDRHGWEPAGKEFGRALSRGPRASRKSRPGKAR